MTLTLLESSLQVWRSVILVLPWETLCWTDVVQDILFGADVLQFDCCQECAC